MEIFCVRDEEIEHLGTENIISLIVKCLLYLSNATERNGTAVFMYT